MLTFHLMPVFRWPWRAGVCRNIIQGQVWLLAGFPLLPCHWQQCRIRRPIPTEWGRRLSSWGSQCLCLAQSVQMFWMQRFASTKRSKKRVIGNWQTFLPGPHFQGWGVEKKLMSVMSLSINVCQILSINELWRLVSLVFEPWPFARCLSPMEFQCMRSCHELVDRFLYVDSVYNEGEACKRWPQILSCC